MPANQLAKVATGPLAVREEPQRVALMHMLQGALDKGTDPAALKVVGELIERMEDRWAVRAFAAAKADFQAECPLVRKATTANIVSQKKGTRFQYSYAELPEIERTIAPYRHKHGLSHEWTTEETKTGRLFCVCIVRHVAGHSAESRVPCTIDNAAAMTDPQKQGSAMTYSKRQSLIAAYGLTACDPDDDGAGGTAAFEKINKEQAAQLQEVLEGPDFSLNDFLSHFKIESVGCLSVGRHIEAWQMIRTKQARLAEGAKP